MHIRIGTRGSRLAMWQAYHIEGLLNRGGITTEIVPFETKGDKILDRSLSKIGSKGVFTEELEEALRAGAIDIAVHSAKDVQSELDPDLELIAFSARERVNDVLVSDRKELSLESSGPFVVGTSSVRRIALLRHYYPNIKTVEMRGNLQTRLGKMRAGACDALLLAYAGVHRMEYDDLITAFLPLEKFTPPVGQGCVAVESCTDLPAEKRARLIALINDPATELCLRAERAFLKRLEGGCSIPAFCLATLDGETVSMRAGIAAQDGSEMIRRELSFTGAGAAEDAGRQLAGQLLEAGADRILSAIRG